MKDGASFLRRDSATGPFTAISISERWLFVADDARVIPAREIAGGEMQ
jgi:hypothetical protein